MNRRSASRASRILVAVLLTIGTISIGSVSVDSYHASAANVSAEAAPPATNDIPVDTANPFLPDEADLTSCVGTLQRPGCGSSERGGWQQSLVAIAMISGLVLIFGRVAWGVMRNRRNDGDVASTP